MNALSRPHPEAPTARRERQLDYFRRASEKASRAIDIASDQLEAAHATGEPGATASPTLDLARATRALVLAVNAENRVVAGQAAPRAPASDRRRILLRDALHQAANAEPDPKRRAAVLRDADERIEETLLADPDSEIDTVEHLCAIADELHIAIDPAKLSDEILGIQSHKYPEPGLRDVNDPNVPTSRSADTGDPPYQPRAGW